jgi:hypothetical protein
MARKTVDVTGRIHLEVIKDEEIVSLHQGDEFFTIKTKVEL